MKRKKETRGGGNKGLTGSILLSCLRVEEIRKVELVRHRLPDLLFPVEPCHCSSSCWRRIKANRYFFFLSMRELFSSSREGDGRTNSPPTVVNAPPVSPHFLAFIFLFRQRKKEGTNEDEASPSRHIIIITVVALAVLSSFMTQTK